MSTLQRLFIMLAAVLVINIIAILLYQARNQSSYAAVIIDKTHLLESTQPPRIIMVGGSNVAFGFNSEALQSKTHLTVINAGQTIGLGLPYMLAELKPHIGEGDIIVISPEYHLLLSINPKDKFTRLQTLIIFPASMRYYTSVPEIISIPINFPAVHTDAVRSMLDDQITKGCIFCSHEDEIYKRAGFNDHGDYIDHLRENLTLMVGGFSIGSPAVNAQTEAMVKTMNSFAEYAKSVGAVAVFSYPSITKPEDPAIEEALNDLHKYLLRELTFTIIDDPQSEQYQSGMMFNSVYHLNGEGREIRTQKVLQALCRNIPDLCK